MPVDELEFEGERILRARWNELTARAIQVLHILLGSSRCITSQSDARTCFRGPRLTTPQNDGRGRTGLRSWGQ